MRRRFPMVCFALAAGCGGGAPLLHSVRAVEPGDVTFGAGFSGTTVARGVAATGSDTDRTLAEKGAFGPGLAPWVGTRLGFGQGLDGGLTYTGRAVRLDGRRVFALTPSVDLSLGLGATGLLPQRHASLGLRVGGFGADVPVLVGWRSSGDVYSVWLGARGGGERMSGQRELPPDPSNPDVIAIEGLRGWHAFAGGLLGMRIGVGNVFALLEVDAAMHWASADIGARAVSLTSFALAPAGAVVTRF